VPRPWGEGSRTEIEERFAAKRAREGRLPSAVELWSERLARRLDELGLEGHKLEREWVEVMICETDTELDVLVDGRWQPHPHRGDEEWARARQREATVELGEKVGVGPPPDDFFGD
jgi:hypothetical protein